VSTVPAVPAAFGTATAFTAGARRSGGAGGGQPRGGGIRGRERVAGWVFVAPMIAVLGVFLIAPILMALWVSVSNWTGQGSPLSSSVGFVGGRNYSKLLADPGLTQADFMTSIRNNFYFVLFVVPLQTVLALSLALVVNGRRLRGKGFFRTAFYFPSVTSSVAISVVFLFLFSSSGVVNALLSAVGLSGPQWFADPRGLFQVVLGGLGMNTDSPPSALADHGFGGLTFWDWLAGPSIAMCAIIALVVWTTAGSFMLMFLAALQDIPVEVEEAAEIDGANAWQRLRRVTIPMMRPTLFLVLTLGLIGTWQIFDQIYIMSKGAPGKTTLTPAYLSYQSSFINQDWGQGAAISFILFVIIVVLTLLQRWLLRERGARSSLRSRFGGPLSPGRRARAGGAQ
jgi:multiple sugar transport system permease protein